jgi:hypothetical protein
MQQDLEDFHRHHNHYHHDSTNDTTTKQRTDKDNGDVASGNVTTDISRNNMVSTKNASIYLWISIPIK